MTPKQIEAKKRKIEQVFATNMKFYREQLGITQRELADAVNMHRISIVRIEGGSIPMKLSDAALIAEVLGVNLVAMTSE